MDKFFGGVVVCLAIMSLIVAAANPYQKGMIAVASGQYSCEMKERVDKTAEWVCERVK